jgi:hypothetical protein
MTYQCPKGHQSTDSDYCSECGALIGQSNISKVEQTQDSHSNKSAGSGEICPDCGTPRDFDARFCEVCRHDFLNNKTGVAEAIVASQKPADKPSESQVQKPLVDKDMPQDKASAPQAQKPVLDENTPIFEKLNVVISVDKDKAATCEIDTPIKPDTVDRVFPLDLDENLVGRRSAAKGIFPEIVINDPGVSHRHLMFIKQPGNSFSVLELGSSNGTEFNGSALEPGVTTPVKAGDEFGIGIWTKLKLVAR